MFLFIYLNFNTRIFCIETFIEGVGNPIFALKRQIMKPEPSLVCNPALVSSVETERFQNPVLEK